jgi:hypothetical protein
MPVADGPRTVRLGPADELPTDHAPGAWDLFCAGYFEADVARVTAARALVRPPRVIGAVAAGVRDFGSSGSHGCARHTLRPHR